MEREDNKQNRFVLRSGSGSFHHFDIQKHVSKLQVQLLQSVLSHLYVLSSNGANTAVSARDLLCIFASGSNK